MSADENKLWSLEQLREVSAYHGTLEAKEMYERHDYPAHRLLGDMTNFEDSGMMECPSRYSHYDANSPKILD